MKTFSYYGWWYTASIQTKGTRERDDKGKGKLKTLFDNIGENHKQYVSIYIHWSSILFSNYVLFLFRNIRFEQQQQHNTTAHYCFSVFPTHKNHWPKCFWKYLFTFLLPVYKFQLNQQNKVIQLNFKLTRGYWLAITFFVISSKHNNCQ